MRVLYLVRAIREPCERRLILPVVSQFHAGCQSPILRFSCYLVKKLCDWSLSANLTRCFALNVLGRLLFSRHVVVLGVTGCVPQSFDAAAVLTRPPELS